MKLFKKIAFLVFILISNFSYSQGLIFDSLEYSKMPSIPIERGLVPESNSLERYLPILYPQSASTCVAMSYALARTILYAKEYGITDPVKITATSMSPYFIYYMARENNDYSCDDGLNPLKAGVVARDFGFVRMANVEYPNYYPFSSSSLCPSWRDFYPPEISKHISMAKKFKIADLYIANNSNEIKYALSKNLPVVVGLSVPKSFENLKSSIWIPGKYEYKNSTLLGHAIVAIAYDDNFLGGAIQIANSWGEEWGYKGKAWIRYKDLNYWMKGGFIMEPSTNLGAELPDKLDSNSDKKPESKTIVLKQKLKTIKFNNKDFINAFKKKE